MQIGVHKIEDKVDVSVVLGTDHILKSDDIFMTREFLEEYNLSEGPLSICRILKGVKVLLESNDVLRLLINGFPNDAVGSLTYS